MTETVYMRVPLMTENGKLCYLEVRKHEYGDPRSFTLYLPDGLNRKLSLPRNLFSEEVNAMGIET